MNDSDFDQTFLMLCEIWCNAVMTHWLIPFANFMTSGRVMAYSWLCPLRMAIALLCPLMSWSLARLSRSVHSWTSSPRSLPVRKRAREHQVVEEPHHPCPAPTLHLSEKRKKHHQLLLKRSERLRAWRPNHSPGVLPSTHWRDGANPAPQNLLSHPLNLPPAVPVCPNLLLPLLWLAGDHLPPKLPKLPQAPHLLPSVPETPQHLKDPPLGKRVTLRPF